MSEIKTDLKYTKTHDWVRNNGDGTWTIGITDYAQNSLGDIVFVELPTVDDDISQSKELCVLESVKAASGVNAPCDLTITQVNQRLEDEPELINQDCYNKGYLAIFKADSLDGLLDADAYQSLIDSE